MKERITYILHPGTHQFDHLHHLDFSDPTQISVRDIAGCREWQIVLKAEDLKNVMRVHPGTEDLAVLMNSDQLEGLTLRWASPVRLDDDSALNLPGSVFGPTLPPGLHLFIRHKPSKDSGATSSHWDSAVCDDIKKVFGRHIKCDSVQKSFTTTNDANVYQFYDIAPSLKHLVSFLRSAFCPLGQESCVAEVESLLGAHRVDIDFDAVADTIRVSALWDESKGPWTETLSPARHGLTEGSKVGKVEVGVLQFQPGNEADEVSALGLLAVAGEDKESKPTRFEFPSRHHRLPLSHYQLSFSTSFDPPAGLHPNLRLRFGPRSLVSGPRPDCSLYAYLTIPSHLFVDQYQLRSDQTQFLEPRNLRRLVSVSGATDLEAPDWAVSKWGSAALFELAMPDSDVKCTDDHCPGGDHWDVSIPLHVRYLPPSERTNRTAAAAAAWPEHWHSTVSEDFLIHAPLPVPAVFMACAAAPVAPADVVVPFSTNPFDRVNLGYDSHVFSHHSSKPADSDGRSVFFHISPSDAPTNPLSPSLLYASVPVPVLDSSWAGWVRQGTAGVVALGFLVVIGALLKVLLTSPRSEKKKEGTVESKKTQ